MPPTAWYRSITLPGNIPPANVKEGAGKTPFVKSQVFSPAPSLTLLPPPSLPSLGHPARSRRWVADTHPTNCKPCSAATKCHRREMWGKIRVYAPTASACQAEWVGDMHPLYERHPLPPSSLRPVRLGGLCVGLAEHSRVNRRHEIWTPRALRRRGCKAIGR